MEITLFTDLFLFLPAEWIPVEFGAAHSLPNKVPWTPSYDCVINGHDKRKGHISMSIFQPLATVFLSTTQYWINNSCYVIYGLTSIPLCSASALLLPQESLAGNVTVRWYFIIKRRFWPWKVGVNSNIIFVILVRTVLLLMFWEISIEYHSVLFIYPIFQTRVLREVHIFKKNYQRES